MKKRRVVVTGMGAITPIGNNIQEFETALFAGVSGAAPITLFDASKFKTRFACEVKGVDIISLVGIKEAKRTDRFTHLAIVAGDEAIKNANLTDNLDKKRIGVIWGSGIGGLKTFEDEIKKYVLNDYHPRFNPFFIPKMILDIAPGILSIRHGLMGPNYSTVSACASATHAILSSYNSIVLDQADMILTGGSEASITEAGIGGFNALRAMSTRNDDPKTASRPFDKDRDGFVLGEGAGALVLEELEHAKKRGANIIAEVLGGGMSADAYHMTAPHPEGLGVSSVMESALKNTSVRKDEIDYINVHGTSTPLGDIAELKAISDIFGDHAYKMKISSTKSMTGHLLGAAGAIEAIASVYTLSSQKIPPTINHFEADNNIDKRFNLTFNKAENCNVNTIMSNTFGFGGHNATVVMKKYQ